MKLFLDDIRHPADKSWTIARDVPEAIRLLKTDTVTFASLDHDLADGHYPWNAPKPYPSNDILVANTGVLTGLNLVEWMRDNDCWPVDGVVVHSQNDIGKERMLEIINKHYFSKIL